MAISEMKTDLSRLGDFNHLYMKMQTAKDQSNYFISPYTGTQAVYSLVI